MTLRYRNIFKISYYIFLILILSLVGFYFIDFKEIHAGITDTMSGWLWSSNIGWISLNSQNCVGLPLGTCGVSGIDYGVNVDNNGNVTGEAWSENFGWLCFGSRCSEWGGLGNAPDGQIPSAAYDGIKLSGWANIYSLKEKGWIKLQGMSTGSGGVGASCFDCYGDGLCKACFTERSPDYGLVGDVCYNCNTCATSTRPYTCNGCASCNKYGLIADSSDSKIYGWAWGGFDDNQGVGWLKASSNYGTLYTPLSWLEIKYGDIYTKGSISGTPAPYGRYNSTYCIHAAGTIGNFTSENTCQISGLDTLVFPEETNLYTNILGKIDRPGILNGKYGEVISISKTEATAVDLITILNKDCLEGKIYYFTGNLSIDQEITFRNSASSQSNGSGLIIVEGNLNINANTFYQVASVEKIKQLASVGWMVKGNLNINGSVTNAVGAYYIEGSGGVSTGSSGNFLRLYGLLIAKNYNFQRTYQSIAEGSEQIIYDGRALVNTPPGMRDMTKALPLWREAAP